MGIYTATLRSPFANEELDETLRLGYLNVLKKYDPPWLVSYTANVVLQGRDEEGRTTYKVHFGSDYSPTDERCEPCWAKRLGKITSFLSDLPGFVLLRKYHQSTRSFQSCPTQEAFR